jgi:hypothetical protein
MSYFAGLDIGSTAIKVALVDRDGRLVGVHVAATGSHFHRNAQEALQTLLVRHDIAREQLRYLIATGYGRKLFKEADDSISEITANALGAHEVGKAFGGVRTIINIGGQDSPPATSASISTSSEPVISAVRARPWPSTARVPSSRSPRSSACSLTATASPRSSPVSTIPLPGAPCAWPSASASRIASTSTVDPPSTRDWSPPSRTNSSAKSSCRSFPKRPPLSVPQSSHEANISPKRA